MAENSEDTTPQPATATEHNAGPPATNNNAGAEARERQHQVLQQVLRILADPIDEIPATINEETKKVYDQNKELRSILSSMAGLLRDKSGQCLTMEKRISAQATQIASLKDVVSLTKDLLNIRNKEVHHLQEDMAKMEGGLDDQRKQYNQTILRLDQAFKLNNQLKEEYQTQLRLFQELKEKYELRAKLNERNQQEKIAEVSKQQ